MDVSREGSGLGVGAGNRNAVLSPKRVLYVVLAWVAGLIVGVLVIATLDTFLDHRLSRGIGKGTAFGIALCFMDGYPRASRRQVSITFSLTIAGAVLISFLRG